MKIAILGSGNGAHAVAFECARAGHEVHIFDFPQFSRSVDAIREAGGITSTGKMEGFEKISYAGTDLAAVLSGAKLVIAVGPSYSTEPFGRACAPYVEDGQIFVVMPGSCMGALAFKNALGLDIRDSRITVAETNTLPYAVRISGPARIEVFHRLLGACYIASIPREKNEEVYALLSPFIPGLEKAATVFETTLNNSNPTIHPVVSTLNAGWIERTHGNFEFYHDGVTPAVGNLMKAIDQERIRLAHAMGVSMDPGPKKGLRQGYTTFDTDDYCLLYSTSEGFAGIKAQSQLDHRYYNEDLGFTMMFWLDLAERMGVELPCTQALVTIVSAMMQKDYRKDPPRTLASLGLGSWTREELLAL